MKAAIVVIDGIGDRPLKKLGSKTPLEAARRRNLDYIASRAINGLLYPVAPGIRPGSDTAHLSILGYDALSSYTGRGPFEAAGAGIKVKPGDIALRCNFATVDDNLVVLDRRAGRKIPQEEKEVLEKVINEIELEEAEIIFKSTLDHRGALVLRGKNLSDRISDTDPHVEGERIKKAAPLDKSKEAEKTCEILNEVITTAHKKLKTLEINKKREKEGKKQINMLLTRGAGKAPAYQSFSEKYNMKGACIATVALVKGVGRFVGLEGIEVKDDASITELGEAALKTLEKYDFVLLNIKACDDASHDKNPERKIAAIEEIDSMLRIFLEFIGENYLVLLGDHTTSCSRGDHCAEPTPIAIAGPEVRVDDARKFTEREAAKGALGHIRGSEVMPILIDLLNRSEKFGA